MHGIRIAPKAEQRCAAGGELGRDAAPLFRIHDDTRPGSVRADAPALGNDFAHGRHRVYPSNLATFWNHDTTAGGM